MKNENNLQSLVWGFNYENSWSFTNTVTQSQKLHDFKRKIYALIIQDRETEKYAMKKELDGEYSN